jgi:hypothetical protein
LELEPGLLEQELGAIEAWSLKLPKLGAWSCQSLELGVVGVRELWLEPERDPRGTHVSIFTFFSFVCFVCFVCSSLLCSCGAVL